MFMILPRSWGYIRGEKREEYLRELTEIAEMTKDPCAMGFVHYIKSGKYYDEGELSNGYKEATEALSYGNLSGDFWLTAMALNNIGVYHGIQENTITAFDYYWRAIDCIYRAQQKDSPLLFLLYGNIGECMLAVKEYQKALDYYAFLETFDIPEDFVHAPMNYAFSYICEIECYFMLGQYDEAWKLVQKMEVLEAAHEETKTLHFAMLVWKYILLYLEGKKEELLPIREELLQFQIKSVTLPSLKTLGNFLFENQEFDFFLQVNDQLETMAKIHENLALYLASVNLRLKYLRMIGDSQAYADTCILYYQLQQEREEQELYTRSSSLNTIVAVAERADHQREMERVHKLLKEKSENDELTGLPNRYKLKEHCDFLFEKAVSENQAIAVEILDVDCFKQLNDHYGHPEGDKCLKIIADEITKTLAEYELGARYGGDEFVIVRYGRTSQEVRRLLEELKQNIMDRNIKNAFSSVLPIVTISQGAVNCIPKAGEQLSHFLETADRALYRSKKDSKNSYTLDDELYISTQT